jgi:signal transduction histidine kinase
LDTKSTKDRFKLFWLCAGVSICVALLLDSLGWLNRLELQSVNRMFEARQWLKWNPDSLYKVNPVAVWQYHEAHEIPHRIWAWDYTLSWLIGDNHPQPKNKIVIFNHMLEDEPPLDAVAEHPWMKPLLHFPAPRSTVAQAVRTLAKNGARLIILDNDFPQYSDEDATLAAAIHECGVPVLMASTANRRNFTGGMQLEGMTLPIGVLEQLQKLEPGVDVRQKYTGLTTIAMDEDQIVRRIFTNESVVSKTMSIIGHPGKSVPSLMNIDFAAQPNSELYPVRPFSYLLDPDKVSALNNHESGDVTVDGAIVILGDSVQDVYATPLTNVGVNLMSGAEILANSIDTISRQSWLLRLDGPLRALYLIVICLIAAAISPSRRVIIGWLGCVGLAFLAYSMGFVWFAFAGLIVPVVVPALAVASGSLAGVLFERERAHETEIKLQKAEARAKEIALDDQRRSEFVRRINHDLKAPVTVLNWTLAKLKREGLSSTHALDRLEHIERTSDRLFSLIAELVRTYETNSSEKQNKSTHTDLREILEDAARLHESMGEMRNSTVTLDLPSYAMTLKCDRLEMARVMDNIVRNAILHNPPGTTIEVSARKRANVHQIEITDNGTGIGNKELQKIFEPGYTTSTEKEGHGLGLSIAKTLVEKAGGSIQVESEEEVGTKFIISLPASEGIDLLRIGQ